MKRWFLVLLPVLVLASLIGWRINQKRADALAQEGQRAARMKAPLIVTAVPARVQDVLRIYEATGTVESPQNVKIAPKVSGRIDYLTLREGDRVRKGQVLVRIDPSQVRANVREEMAALAEARYRLAQAQINENPTNVSVSSQIRQQAAGLASAKADLNQVEKNYDAELASAKAAVTAADAKVRSAGSDVNSAQANLENARSRYKRMADLLQKGFVAAQDAENAKTLVTVQEAAVQSAQEQLASAKALKDASQQQESIARVKGLADIEAARARVEQVKASHDAAKANTAQVSAYQQSIAALRAQVDAAKASLLAAQAQLQDTVLVSPLDGYVTGRYMDPGAMATPGQPIISVQFMKQVWVTISVPEEISALVRMGQKADVRLDALPDRKLTGTVVQVNPSADMQSRQFMVRISMDNSAGILKPGMFSRASLEVGRVKGAIVVPREALEQDDFGSYVMIVAKGNKAERKNVVPGVSDTSVIAIDSGLAPGDKAIVMSTFPVKPGMTVIPGGKPGGRGQRGGKGER